MPALPPIPAPARRRRSAAPLFGVLVALCAAAPASAHMLMRGNPLSELAAGAPLAVIGTVRPTEPATGKAQVALAVERSVLGAFEGEVLHFAAENHHPPEFAVGERVLVFLTTEAPPFASRQSALDLVVLPDAPAEVESIVGAVQAYTKLRAIPGRLRRAAGLKALSIEHLESPSPALRREALLDLLGIGAGHALDGEEVARVAELAKRADVPATLGPGLVMLLASAPRHGPAALGNLAEHAASPRVRTLAAQALERSRSRRSAASTTRSSTLPKEGNPDAELHPNDAVLPDA